MSRNAAVGSMKVPQDDHDEHLLGLGSPGLSSVSQDITRGSKKRPHQYTAKDEADEDDLSDELSNPADKKRRLTVEQVKFLEMSFNMDLKLEPERKALIAKQLGLRPRQVAIWFQNRRARWKNKQLEQDYETLKAKYEAVIKEKESIVNEHELFMEGNKKLQAEVARLTSLLQGLENHSMSDMMGVGSETELIKVEQVSGKSELTSPTKLADDQSEMQDSGQSYLTSLEAEKVALIEPSFEELNSAIACAVKLEMEDSSILPPDDVFGSFPLLVQQLAANGFLLEDAYNLFLSFEDQFGGLQWCG